MPVRYRCRLAGAVVGARAPSDHTTVCRLLVKHHSDLARWRTSWAVACMPWWASWCPAGSTAKWLSTRHDHCWRGFSPRMSQGLSGHRQALELVAEIDRLDAQLRDSRRRTTTAGRRQERRSRRSSAARSSPRCSSASAATRPGSPPPHASPRTRDGADRVLLRWTRHPPAVAARQPATQPRPAHRRDHPDPPYPQSRPRHLRPKGRRRQDAPRSDPRVEAAAQRRRVATPHRRRQPHHALNRGPGQDTPGTAQSPAWPPHT